MGAAIAARLASVGHEMMVWNRNADKARATGLQVADSPQALADGCEAVISIVTDAAAVQSLYEKLLAGKVSGKLFIEMSTVRPAAAKKPTFEQMVDVSISEDALKLVGGPVEIGECKL